MKKTYTQPEVQVIGFASEDIITASGGLVEGNFTVKTGNVDKEIKF
ncbi:MAG: hypothetical protein IKS17_00265 [Firmicutes bacterium]|nr:hypothetical protein [Bacillota bacterium]